MILNNISYFIKYIYSSGSHEGAMNVGDSHHYILHIKTKRLKYQTIHNPIKIIN